MPARVPEAGKARGRKVLASLALLLAWKAWPTCMMAFLAAFTLAPSDTRANPEHFQRRAAMRIPPGAPVAQNGHRCVVP